MNLPENLRYTKDHEWIRIEGTTAFVGITDFAQGELGDIVFVDINMIDETVKVGEAFGSIEAVKTVSDLFAPVGGDIAEVNAALDEEPELINTDPYGKGWIVRIDNIVIDESVLMDGPAYQAEVSA